MTTVKKKKGTIAILTGGGDVPGLNPAIRAITIRALREGYQVIGLRRGWAGITELVRDKKADNSEKYIELTEELVNKAGRTGGTFLHTSRTRPSHVTKSEVPEQYRDKYKNEINDLTDEVIKNLEYLGVDYLIPIGGDDTLTYGVRLYAEGVKVVAIPKTMDNDVPEPTIALVSVPVLPAPSRCATHSGHRRVRMNGSWCWKCSAGMPVSQLCCQRWRVRQTVV